MHFCKYENKTDYRLAARGSSYENGLGEFLDIFHRVSAHARNERKMDEVLRVKVVDSTKDGLSFNYKIHTVVGGNARYRVGSLFEDRFLDKHGQVFFRARNDDRSGLRGSSVASLLHRTRRKIGRIDRNCEN